MRTRRVLIVAGLILAGAIIFTACGDDDVAALSKPDFIVQANAICATADAELEPVFDAMWNSLDEDFDMEDPAQQQQIFVLFDEAVTQASPIWDSMIDDIRALGPPSGDEELIATLLDDLETALAEFDETIDAAVDGDEAAREALDGDEPMADVDRRAREYGLDVCGDPG